MTASSAVKEDQTPVLKGTDPPALGGEAAHVLLARGDPTQIAESMATIK